MTQRIIETNRPEDFDLGDDLLEENGELKRLPLVDVFPDQTGALPAKPPKDSGEK